MMLKHLLGKCLSERLSSLLIFVQEAPYVA